MRSITAASTSGPDAIQTAILYWWLNKTRTMEKVAELAEKVGTGAFLSLTDVDVGSVLIEKNDIGAQIEADINAHPDIKFIADLASLTLRSLTASLSSDLGNRLKKTDWWKANLKEIERHKRNLKTVRKVMES